jgi:ElaB/YqjD/DUF883 family membrane-anchored ribosome-binding protein
MRQADVKKQFDAAISNMESALQDLAERLEDFPGMGKRRSRLSRAGRSLRRTADSVTDHIPLERASAFAADTGRTVRQHPVTALLTAAVAGYVVWSVIRFSNERAASARASRRHRPEASAKPSESPQPGGEYRPEPDSHARH